MADVKIKIIIDDSGALAELKRFSDTFKDITDNQKKLNNQFKRTFKSARRQAKKVRDNFNDIGKAAKVNFNKVGKEATNASKKLKGVNNSLSTIKNVFTGVFIADTLRASINLIRRGIVDTIKEFADFEKGLVGVGKTADITGKELENLGKELLNLDLTASNRELLELAQVAGQLGIKGSSNIVKFTQVMAKLQSATNVAGQEGASAIARILNVTKTSTQEVDRFASALVELGNNSAATESEILSVAQRVAEGTAVYKLSAQETLAFGAALRSLGVRAEVGGSSVARAFKAIDNALSTGGSSLRNFNTLLGTTTEGLRKSFSEDRVGVVLKFLNALSKQGLETTSVLNGLGLSDIRVSSTLGTLASNIGIVNDKFAEAKSGYEDNIALNDEYERTLETLNGQWSIFKQNVSDVAIILVEELAPALSSVLTSLNELLNPTRKSGDLGLKVSEATARVLNEELELLNKRVRQYNEAGIDGKQLKPLLDKVKEINDELERRSKFQSISAVGEEQQKEATTEDGAAKNEQKLALLDAFNTARVERITQQALDELNIEEFRQSEEFRLLEEGLGKREALETTSRVNKLLEEGKTQKALMLLRQQANKAEIAIEKKDADKKKKRDEELLRNRKALAGNLLTVGKIAGGGLFKITQATSLGIATIDGFTAIQKAATIAPFPENLPSIIAETARAATTIAGIKSAKPSFQEGGIVPGTSFSGDNVAANVNSGEMILNRQQQAQLFQQANGRSPQGSQEIVVNTTVDLDGETVARSVSRQVANGFELGEQT